MLQRRAFLAAVPSLAAASAVAQTADWPSTLARARGQTVRFNAWGGDDRTNAFIAWVGQQAERQFSVKVEHVRLRDTADAVQRVISERGAGRVTDGGSVDLIWINGPNLAHMRREGLLHGPFVADLPGFAAVDITGKPATVIDFALPVQGYAAPWLMAQIVYVYDSARLASPPTTLPAMLEWARSRPGRIAHPHGRNFLGATFLKQALVSLAPDARVLQTPLEDATYAAASAPMWAWYRALRPLLWRAGSTFPADGPQAQALLGDGAIDLTVSFNPAEASGLIATGRLPASVRTFVLEGGTIGNASFVAIPINASAKAGAMVVADLLLSPEAQARAADERVLGQGSVLAIDKLPVADQLRFEQLPRGPATLDPRALGQTLNEPHPSWMTRVTADWLALVQG
jgi:putative thiamine transport system substrate-binding protein